MMGPHVANVFADTGNGYQNVGSNTHASGLADIMNRYGGGGGNAPAGSIASMMQQSGQQRPSNFSSTFRATTQPGGAPLGAGGGGDINGLLGRQQTENDWAKNKNEANWQEGRSRLLGVGQDYNNSQTNNATRNLVNQFVSNPEAINDRTQQMIQNKASNTIEAQSNNQMRRTAGMMAGSGQMDAASMAAASERIGRSGMAQRVGQQSALEVQRANQRNGDFQNAIGAGQRQGQQDFNAGMGVANSFLENMPQYKPQDMSGWLAAYSGGQGGQGMAMQGGGGGQGMAPGSFGGGFTGFQSMGGSNRVSNFKNPAPNNGTMSGPSGNMHFGPGTGQDTTSGYGGPSRGEAAMGGRDYNSAPAPQQKMWNSGGMTQNPYAAKLAQMQQQQQQPQPQLGGGQQVDMMRDSMMSGQPYYA